MIQSIGAVQSSAAMMASAMKPQQKNNNAAQSANGTAANAASQKPDIKVAGANAQGYSAQLANFNTLQMVMNIIA